MKRNLHLLLVVATTILFGAGLGISKSSGKADRGWLGVYTQSVDYELADAFELGTKYGAVVNDVIDGSPADKAGLDEEDVIIAVDGKKVTDSEDLVYLLDKYKSGDEVVLIVIRDGAEQTVTVTLGDSPPKQRHYRSGRMDDDKRYFYSYRFGESSYIGVRLQNLTEQLAEYFGLENQDGALITSVEEDSPAAEAGLKAGDVIVAIDDDEIESSHDVSDIIGDFDEGDTVVVSIIRDRTEQRNVDVVVAEREHHGRYHSIGPDLDVLVPHLQGLHFSDFPGVEMYWDDKEFQAEMEKLRDELKDLHIEFDKGEFEKEMDELQRELKEMKKELRKELDEIHRKID